MDPVTHVMGGAITSHIFAGSAPEPAATLTAVAAAVLPDFDYLSRKLPGATFLKVHHGATHSLIGLTVQSILIASASYAVFSFPAFKMHSLNWWMLLFISFCSAASHVLLDYVMHNNGLPLLWPFTYRRFALPLILGVNPMTVSRKCGEKKYMTCFGCQARASFFNPIAWVFAISGLAGFWSGSWRPAVGWACVLVSAVYLVTAYRMRERARRSVIRTDPDMQTADAYPARARMDRWLFVKDTPFHRATAYLADAPSGSVLRKWVFSPPLVSPFIESATRRIYDDLKFAIRHLYPEVSADEDRFFIRFRDLSYLYSEPLEIGSVQVVVDNDGHVVSETYQEVW